ncbi:hypothetical protein [Streptomyces odonnellii]|uniref:hypothetical protein n=1 Tax=Streptomyces odonnellii TaxID=1417980 RepID=UPI000625C108|nr:hypothetical protein [Streptomyces odonnellii]
MVLQARPDFYDQRATALHAAGNLDLIKDDHNLLVAGIDPNTELGHVLKGLHYANVHLAADRTGTSSRIDAWIAAVGAARGRADVVGSDRRHNITALDRALARLHLVRR